MVQIFLNMRLHVLMKIKECRPNIIIFINPIKGDVSDSQLNAGGGHFDHSPEINERVLKVILRATKFMITCKKSGQYLKHSLRY